MKNEDTHILILNIYLLAPRMPKNWSYDKIETNTHDSKL